jgi:hypothetical protein
MSIKINKRQLIAAELLGVGHKPSDVAKKLALRRETISRWQVNPDFILAKEKAYLEVLSNIIKESTLLTNKAHQALLEAFEDQEISKVAKATIGIRYLTLVGAQSTAYEKSNSKYIELSKRTDNNEVVAKWFVDVLDGIRDLKPSRGEISDNILRKRVYKLINLSNNMPKH